MKKKTSSYSTHNKQKMKAHIQSRNEEFFKLSAAAVESLPAPDIREQEFHEYIREILVRIKFSFFFLP